MTFDVTAQVHRETNYGWKDWYEAFSIRRNCRRPTIFLVGLTEYNLHQVSQAGGFLVNFDKSLNRLFEVDRPIKRRDLGLRLHRLFEQGLLPRELEELARCIREDANDGAHAGSLSKEDADDVLDFTTALLERLYTLPNRLELAEERRSQRRSVK